VVSLAQPPATGLMPLASENPCSHHGTTELVLGKARAERLACLIQDDLAFVIKPLSARARATISWRLFRGCRASEANRSWSVEKIFAVINQMEADGVIGRYAIGGAVGAIFWLEPITTKDVDVFVTLPSAPGGTLLTLGPIYEYLLANGFRPEGQFIVIEGWAVEFVPPGTPLVEEALAQAVERDVNGVLTRVFTAEHLAVICLQVGRPKDHDRVIRFVEAGVLDAELFEAILLRHALMEKWIKFQQTYLDL